MVPTYNSQPVKKNFKTADPKLTEALYTASQDQQKIAAKAKYEEELKRKYLAEQKGIQSTRLQELAKLLSANANDTFSGEIPGIAEDAQANGMLETSGFRDKLVSRKEDLNRDVAFQIAKQGLADRDFEVDAIGDISKNTTDFDAAGLSRDFSLQDQSRADQLARELGRMGIVAPPKGPSSFDQTLDRTSQMVSIAGGVAGIAGGK